MCLNMVDRVGLEPTAHGLKVRYSTTELPVYIGRCGGIRTHGSLIKSQIL